VAAVINATLSSASANSYVTLAEADAYFETIPDSSTWTTKTTDQKNRALISATRWIDSLNFYGDRCDNGQALKWPRNNWLIDRVELVCNVIPKEIKFATYELARELANDTDAITNTQVELGELRVQYKEGQANGVINNVFDVYPWLQAYLGAYTIGGAGGFQLRAFRG
jgi:hypothetical protein